MSRYTITAGQWFRRDVRLSSASQICFGCDLEIPKGEFYISDKLERPNPAYSRSPRIQPVEIQMSLGWHMNCAPLTRKEAKETLLSALAESAKPEPTRLEKVKER